MGDQTQLSCFVSDDSVLGKIFRQLVVELLLFKDGEHPVGGVFAGQFFVVELVEKRGGVGGGGRRKAGVGSDAGFIEVVIGEKISDTGDSHPVREEKSVVVVGLSDHVVDGVKDRSRNYSVGQFRLVRRDGKLVVKPGNVAGQSFAAVETAGFNLVGSDGHDPEFVEAGGLELKSVILAEAFSRCEIFYDDGVGSVSAGEGGGDGAGQTRRMGRAGGDGTFWKNDRESRQLRMKEKNGGDDQND